MPHRYVDELKNRPRGDLSFTKANSDILLGKYTGIDEVNEQSIEVVGKDLTRHIPGLLGEVVEEVGYAFKREFGGGEGEDGEGEQGGWKEVLLHEKVLRVVSMVSSRIFVTKEVSRTEDWIQASIQYTADVFAGGQELKKWHPWLRPLMFRLLAPMRRLESMKATARRLLFPILEAREREKKAGKREEYRDTIYWMQQRSRHIPTFDFKEQAHVQLIIGLAAIHTTGMATTHMLYDLAARQEYVEPLRQEVEKVLGMEGGKLKKQGLGRLRLMDSFMKESQRLSPIALSRSPPNSSRFCFFYFCCLTRIFPAFFTRKTSVPITLHDGFHVPAGTHLTCNEQQQSSNPRVWGELDKFDGFRFAKRADEGVEESSKLAFHTTSVESMAFGHGRHACPGRYFAEAEIKAILCHILMNYDIKFPDTVTERPRNIFFETAIMPDPTQKVLLRRRR